jgi:N-terminal acetyltransferase B complex non-catalytic subunit
MEIFPCRRTRCTLGDLDRELLKVAMFMAGSKAHTSTEIETALGEVENWLKANHQGPDGMEIFPCRRTRCTLGDLDRRSHDKRRLLVDSRKALKTAKLPAEQIERLNTLVREVFEDVRSNTRSYGNIPMSAHPVYLG